MPVKMTPIEAAAGDAVLVGDPRRAFVLAQELTVQPRMSHQARGLWGYVGTTADGRPLTVQATGVGGPSAVPVIGDLAAQGANRMLRLGTCLAIDDSLAAGTLLRVDRALVADGAGRMLSDGADFVRPDPQLTDVLKDLGRAATISSHDLVERYEPAGSGGPAAEPALARDLQTAATLAMCERLGLPAAVLLIVAEDRSGRRLGEGQLEDLFRSTARAAVERLAASGPSANPDRT
jgi:uridine phosphorylase